MNGHTLRSGCTAMNTTDDKDFSLFSGERQVAARLEDIRKDHIYRYELVSNRLRSVVSGQGCGLDLFCGNGYGTYLLARDYPDLLVLGMDGSDDAIRMASDHYRLENSNYQVARFPFVLPRAQYDFVVCMESLEHVDDDVLMLAEIARSLRTGGGLFISVPNQGLHPLEKNPHPFHHRHYQHDEMLTMLAYDFQLTSWFGQDVYEFTDQGINTMRLLPEAQMRPVEQRLGQVLVYQLCRR